MQILRGSFKSCGVNISSRSNWQKPDRDEWGTGLEAMQTALSLEKNVNQALLDLHKIADKHGDAQVNKTWLSYPNTRHMSSFVLTCGQVCVPTQYRPCYCCPEN